MEENLNKESIMLKEEALKVLKNHQRWRLGDANIEATNPNDLTKAIELAIASLGELIEDENRWRKVSEELPKLTSKPYCIAAKDNESRIYIEWILEDYDERVISFLLDKYIEWKPII